MKKIFIALVGMTISLPSVFAATELTVTGATAQDKVYDGLAQPTGLEADITKGKSPATITFINTNQTYHGTARAVTNTTDPAGVKVDITYDGNTWAPTNAGSYAVTGVVDDVNYYGTNTTTLTISKAPLTAGLAPTISKVYDGNTGATLGATNYTFAGLISGETCTVTKTTGLYDSKNAGTGIVVTVTLASTNFADYGGSGFLTNNYVLPGSATGAVGEIRKRNLSLKIQQ